MMLTGEQALRFCGCHCKQRDPLGLYGHQGVCEDCKGSGINTAKRAELEELMRDIGVELLVAAGAYLTEMGPCENADDGEPLCEYPECTYCAMALAHDAAQRARARC